MITSTHLGLPDGKRLNVITTIPGSTGFSGTVDAVRTNETGDIIAVVFRVPAASGSWRRRMVPWHQIAAITTID